MIKRFGANILINFGRLRAPISLKDVKKERREILRQAQAGDILLMGAKVFFGQWLIAGTYTHSGVLDGKGGVIHAQIEHGVERTDLKTTIRRYDRLALVRVKDFDEKELMELIESRIGAPYNFRFSWIKKKQRSFYCSQLVYWAYKNTGVELFPMRKARYIHPSELMNSKQVEVIYSTEN